MKYRPDRPLFKVQEKLCAVGEDIEPKLAADARADLSILARAPLLMATRTLEEFSAKTEAQIGREEGFAIKARCPFDCFVFMVRIVGDDGRALIDMAVGLLPPKDKGRMWALYPLLPTKMQDNLVASKLDGATESDLINQISGIEARLLDDALAYLKKAEESGRYPVEVASKRRPKVKKGQEWKNPTGPRIIYMDSLPTASGEHQGGTHASPEGHLRRGHGRTLRHPRYKNHPLYQQENAMRIKPVWVGPTRTEYQGNIYTLRREQI